MLQLCAILALEANKDLSELTLVLSVLLHLNGAPLLCVLQLLRAGHALVLKVPVTSRCPHLATPLPRPSHLPLFWSRDWTSYLNGNLLSSLICECVSSVDEEVTSKKFVDSVQGQLKLTVLNQDLIFLHEILAILFERERNLKN